MNIAALLVLSRYADLFNKFRDSVDVLEPDTIKILIRSGSDISLIPPDRNWIVRQGPEPFNFSKSVNAGFDIAGLADVVLCGDDVNVYTPNFIHILQEVAYSSPDIAVAVPELGGQSIFVCCYIKREVIDNIGGLDETMGGYGFQDNDYYRRYEAAGYRTMPTTLVRAEHEGGTSYWRGEREGGERVQDQADRMRALFNAKWGTNL